MSEEEITKMLNCFPQIEIVKYILNLQEENVGLKAVLKGTTHCYDEEEHRRLQHENKELKEQYSELEDKYIKNTPCCNEDDCELYKEYLEDKNILTEFEKWLEECIKSTRYLAFDDETKLIVMTTIKTIFDKLQKLKEGKK